MAASTVLIGDERARVVVGAVGAVVGAVAAAGLAATNGFCSTVTENAIHGTAMQNNNATRQENRVNERILSISLTDSKREIDTKKQHKQ